MSALRFPLRIVAVLEMLWNVHFIHASPYLSTLRTVTVLAEKTS